MSGSETGKMMLEMIKVEDWGKMLKLFMFFYSY